MKKYLKYLPIFIAMIGLSVMIVVFLNSATPYVTFNEAKKAEGKHFHVAGDIMRETMKIDLAGKRISFAMKDTEGTLLPVVYQGPQPANMGSVTKIVAIGEYQSGQFNCDRLLVKCPSKYDSEN